MIRSVIQRAYQMARDLLGESLPRRWAHVRGVVAVSRLVAPIFAPHEQDLLIASALLHDIGYSSVIAFTGFHPLDGARYMRSRGLEQRLCALVAHHSCAYREAELRGLSNELTEWHDEGTPLRDALWWADMTTSPDGQPVSFDHRIKEIRNRYGPQDVVTFFVSRAEPELRGAVERTEARLRAAGISYE